MDKRWTQYLYEFHVTRDYYRCHDFLEEWWFELGNPQDHLLMAFIQLAVAQYHWRADNLKGAQILYEKSLRIFKMNFDKIHEYGINANRLIQQMEEAKKNVELLDTFYEYNLPIMDDLLISKLTQLANQSKLMLYAPSDMSDLKLVYHHKYKDQD
jgi:uncharacterized protein